MPLADSAPAQLPSFKDSLRPFTAGGVLFAPSIAVLPHLLLVRAYTESILPPACLCQRHSRGGLYTVSVFDSVVAGTNGQGMHMK
jgi:hypothetical protein